MAKNIGGIQQIGVGVSNADEAFKWYRENLGLDICMGNDKGKVDVIRSLTGGVSPDRQMIFACSLQGGGSVTFWQRFDKVPKPAQFNVKLGDYGIYAAKIKCRDVTKAHAALTANKVDVLGEPLVDPAGNSNFFIKDPYGNLCQIVKSDYWFKREDCLTAGNAGCIIGVSDIERARVIYSEILGYDTVVYDETGVFEDFSTLAGGGHQIRRVLLGHGEPRKGAFSNLIGPGNIELIQVCGRPQPRKILEDRMYGDLGFFYITHDVNGLEAFKDECKAKGVNVLVDSQEDLPEVFRLDDKTESRIMFIEDFDGTLIEFAEVYKIPLLKKLGWYLDLRNRNVEKPLSNWIMKALAFNRVK